jgi:hypothetical protein
MLYAPRLRVKRVFSNERRSQKNATARFDLLTRGVILRHQRIRRTIDRTLLFCPDGRKWIWTRPATSR